MSPFNDRALFEEILQIGLIRFGEFTLKSGAKSPIYFNFRDLISYPALMTRVTKRLWQEVAHLSFDRVCGVPYTALPLATLLSVEHEIPMVLRRKEPKSHGIPLPLEGRYERGQNCLVVEDLITTGASLLETIKPLEQEGLVVTDLLCLLDRCQGGRQRLEEKGYRVHALFELASLAPFLLEKGIIDNTMIQGLLC